MQIKDISIKDKQTMEYKMKITLKNIKHAEFASTDSYCFDASVYVDGKRAFGVSDDGNGGCINAFCLSGDRKKFDEILKKVDDFIKTQTYSCPWSKKEENHNFDTYIGGLLEDWLKLKDLKKYRKKVCYFNEDGKLFSMKKLKPTADILERIKKVDWWKPSYKLLNEMSDEDALKAIEAMG